MEFHVKSLTGTHEEGNYLENCNTEEYRWIHKAKVK